MRKYDIFFKSRGMRHKGVTLIFFYFIIASLLLVFGSFMSRGIIENKAARENRDILQAYYLAEAGIDEAKRGLYDAFSQAHSQPLDGDFDWFETGHSGYTLPNKATLLNIPDREYTVTIDDTIDSDFGQRDVELTCKVYDSNSSKLLAAVTAVIRYGSKQSKVYDYTYFINNFGWFWGDTITAQGDIRSNGDFSFGAYNPTVNGDVCASVNPDLSAAGDIIGSNDYDTIASYRSNADSQARPTDPTADHEYDVNGNGVFDPGEDANGNGILDGVYLYADGYRNEDANGNGILDLGGEDANGNWILDPGEDINGNGKLDLSEDTNDNGTLDIPTHKPNGDILNMPYLGDLSDYENWAASENGTIKQGGVTLVDAVYGDDTAEAGPDGVSGTADDGCIVLIGTALNPIEINGPVVVTGDVLIKGVVKGQGTIFSGRNTHILGNITYENSPAWPKPDTDPDTTDTQNNTKDFLGLATKGNVVIGNYNEGIWNWLKGYLKPPFTQGYETDSSDEGIGYDSDGISGNGYYFDGDYTANDGGKRFDGAGGETDRKYYESFYDQTSFSAIAESCANINRIDAVAYTNHTFTGVVTGLKVNGSIVARDEAIGYYGTITMNYDVRVRSEKGKDKFYLPRELDLPYTLYVKREPVN